MEREKCSCSDFLAAFYARLDDMDKRFETMSKSARRSTRGGLIGQYMGERKEIDRYIRNHNWDMALLSLQVLERTFMMIVYQASKSS